MPEQNLRKDGLEPAVELFRLRRDQPGDCHMVVRPGRLRQLDEQLATIQILQPLSLEALQDRERVPGIGTESAQEVPQGRLELYRLLRRRGLRGLRGAPRGSSPE